ncbi:MAG: hypothetical protein KAT05_04940 [Spirochaetes bacterium]|nr:hypothetical protein [Spirochaetota bacterium]
MQTHLGILGVAYFLVGSIYPLIGFNPYWPMINILLAIQYIFFLIFVKRTFYKSRKSLFIPIIITVSLIWSTIILISFGVHPFHWFEPNFLNLLVIQVLTNVVTFIVYFWMGISSYKTFKLYKNGTIEPWVTKKLKLITISSFILMFVTVPDLFRLDPALPFIDLNIISTIILFYIQLSIVLTSAVIYFLAWVILPFFKESLNKDYISPSELKELESLSEDDIRKQLRGGKDV